MAKRDTKKRKVIIAHYRSRRLAKKHLKKLGKGWRIKSRRRKDGHYSLRGHTFVFVFKEDEEEFKEWLLTWEYDGQKRMSKLDFYVVAISESRAYELVLDHVAIGKDDLGYDLSWAQKIDWDRQFVVEFEHEPGEKKEHLIDERVEVH